MDKPESEPKEIQSEEPQEAAEPPPPLPPAEELPDRP